MIDKRHIPLNLIFDYPVHWSKYKVLRDFIQNFYDSVSYKNFNDNFQYKLTDEGELVLKAINTRFNYEWLVHIGASSKRNESDKYAGYFGEGFKIAALCALRDHKWNVTMSSSDWSIDVVTSNIEIDRQTLVSLAYDVSIFDVEKVDTVLKISSFDKKDFEIFISSLYTFYYKENPLLGKLLWENDYGAIYYRSKLEKTIDFPISYECKGDGCIFGSYQALGSFELPLVFCLHNYKQEDRDRNTYSKIDVINILVGVIRLISPSVSAILLTEFKKYWYTYPTEKYGYKSYYTAVKNLIIKVATDSDVTKLFTNENPNLIVADKLLKSNMQARNRRKQAMSWLKFNHKEYLLVQDTFKRLGYTTVEEECERYDGFTLLRNPNDREYMYISILESFVKEAFSGFFEVSILPICKIITNDSATWAGMAECVKLTNFKYNAEGFKVRNELRAVSLKMTLFRQKNFDEALSTYLHELCHVFGGDNSVNFSKALTKVISKLISYNSLISQYKLKWDAI